MGILQHDVVIMDRVGGKAFDNDFVVLDVAGATIGSVRTHGAALIRFFVGNRDLTLHDTDGSVLLRIVDPPNALVDTYTVRDGWGHDVARVVSEPIPWRRSIKVELTTGAVLHLKGDFLEQSLTVVGPLGEVARVTRTQPSHDARDRYTVAMAPGLPLPERLGAIAAVIVRDVVRSGGGFGKQPR